jgi:PAS domain S-box-containing protein
MPLESANILSALLDNTTDIVHIIDREMNVVRHNTALREWAYTFGFDQDDYVGKNLFELSSKIRAKNTRASSKMGSPLSRGKKTR